MAVIINAATCKHGTIANDYVIANVHRSRKATIGGLHAADNGTVLDVTFSTNRDGVIISSHNATIPNSRAGRNLNISAHSSIRGNIHGRINHWHLAVDGKNRSVTRVYSISSIIC